MVSGGRVNGSAAAVVDKAVFVPSGWDTLERIELLRSARAQWPATATFASVVPPPVAGTNGGLAAAPTVLRAQDEAGFADKLRRLSAPSDAASSGSASAAAGAPKSAQVRAPRAPCSSHPHERARLRACFARVSLSDALSNTATASRRSRITPRLSSFFRVCSIERLRRLAVVQLFPRKPQHHRIK